MRIAFIVLCSVGIGVIRWIVDVFLVSSYVDEKNDQLRFEILNNIQSQTIQQLK